MARQYSAIKIEKLSRFEQLAVEAAFDERAFQLTQHLLHHPDATQARQHLVDLNKAKLKLHNLLRIANKCKTTAKQE